MVRYLALAVMVGLLAAPAAADTSVDDLRALVMAGEIAPVEAALKAAEAADLASGGEPDAERDLIVVFRETHPAVDDFTKRWLAAEPDSAWAMTARGWHLYSLGWAIRGHEGLRETYDDSLAVMQLLHDQAYALLTAAIAADPDLISASDGLFRVVPTVGHLEWIPVGLELVMTRHPNRGSLMRAMTVLAPQWGGSKGQVALLCDRYAPMIKSVPGYDAKVCAVDAAYYADFWPGNQRDAARAAVDQMPLLVLDYARLKDAVDGLGEPKDRQKLLEGVQATRPLTPEEAYQLDFARSQQSVVASILLTPNYEKALTLAVAEQRLKADHDPYNPEVVNALIDYMKQDHIFNHTSFDRADATARLKRLLTFSPYNWKAWRSLGQATLGDLPFHSDDLDRIAEAQPYFTNAIVYSNYGYWALTAAVDAKIGAVISPKGEPKAKDISGLLPDDRAKLDRIIHCPLVTEMRLLQAKCQKDGVNPHDCGSIVGGPRVLLGRLKQIEAQGSCSAEFGNWPWSTWLSPVKTDF